MPLQPIESVEIDSQIQNMDKQSMSVNIETEDVQEVNQVTEDEEMVIRCILCESPFSEEEIYKRHFEDKHCTVSDGEYAVSCPNCVRAFRGGHSERVLNQLIWHAVITHGMPVPQSQMHYL